MVFARVAAFFSQSHESQPTSSNEAVVVATTPVRGDDSQKPISKAVEMWRDEEEEEGRPPYQFAMIAGGLGGTMGDMLMHGLDTVKTRQQGDPHIPPKYSSMASASYTIWRQEGVMRGLYSGVTPAFVGSSFGAVIFFGAYEYTKRQLIDSGVAPSLSYLTAGFLADLASSPIYVPSEVIKTRLQLQGRYNNPFFNSGYNYRSSMHALMTIIRTEGASELFSGYKATILRDLPYSAMQFAFYEKEQEWARQYVGGKDIGLGLEIATGASAGGLAGIITCPLDVVKTRIQTSLDPVAASATAAAAPTSIPTPTSTGTTTRSVLHAKNPNSTTNIPPVQPVSTSSTALHKPHTCDAATSVRHISTGGPSTSLRPAPGTATPLNTESVYLGLKAIYRSEGLKGWFRGVGPRAAWTSIQSGTMLVVYQNVLKWLDLRFDADTDD